MQAAQSLGGEELVYIPEFISRELELYLLSNFSRLFLAKPRTGSETVDFGYRYQPEDGPTVSADFISPLPDYLHQVATRLFLSGLFQRVPEQVVVTRFASDSGTPWHKDSDEGMGDRIALLPLSGSQNVLFKGNPLPNDRTAAIEPRSVLLVSGQYRYQAQHSIKPITDGNTSGDWYLLTFRNVDIRAEI